MKNQVNRHFAKTFKDTKYHSKTQSYNGRNYQSILECNYAMQLDWRVKAKEVKEWIPQFKLDLRVNGCHITNYFIDFKVIFADGHEEYHEVKGYETDVWKMKWDLSKALFPDYTFVLIK
jgi:hypothetical protein